MALIRLLSTDFDGTLIGHPSDGRACPALCEALEAFKSRGGIWAINTGRTLPHALEGAELLGLTVSPDYLLTSERDIFRQNGSGGWEDFGDWNAVAAEHHQALFDESGEVFDAIIEHVARRTDVTLIEESGKPCGLVTTTESAMNETAALIDDLRNDHPNFSYQRNMIYLRFCHAAYDKGSALAELGRLLKINRSEVMAIGDHYNDLPMLDGKHAALSACPHNAIQSVKRQVLLANGYAASACFGKGVAEAIDFFEAKSEDGARR